MADIHDRLRYCRVAQYTSVRREKSLQVPDAHGPSGQAESSTSATRVSPHATPSSSSRRRRYSPSDASPLILPRTLGFTVPHPNVDVIDPLPHPTADVVDPLPPPTDDVIDPLPPLPSGAHVFLSFSFHLCKTITKDLCVPNISF